MPMTVNQERPLWKIAAAFGGGNGTVQRITAEMPGLRNRSLLTRPCTRL
jgi:hypothetical protein